MDSNIKLSATRISTFLQCKQKYWFNYIDKLPKIKNPAFKLGLAVHQALELAGHIWMEKGDFSKEDNKLIADKYKEVSVQEGIDDPEIHDEGLELVKKRLKDFTHDTKGILGLEISFGFKEGTDLVTPNGVPLIGAMDKVLEVDDDTILVVDYKTSKTAPTPDQLKKDVQLSLYDVAANILWPDKRIIVSLDLLKHDILYSYRTPEERAEFIDYLSFIYKEMIGLEQDKAQPTLNTFCGWCDFRDYCEEYKKAFNSTDIKFMETARLKDKALFEEWLRVKNMKNIYTQKEKEIASVLIDKIKAKGKNIIFEGEELYIRQNSRKEYDLGVVASTIPEGHLVDVVSLNKRALETYMDKNPAVKARITERMVTNFTSPFLATKKVK